MLNCRTEASAYKYADPYADRNPQEALKRRSAYLSTCPFPSFSFPPMTTTNARGFLDARVLLSTIHKRPHIVTVRTAEPQLEGHTQGQEEPQQRTTPTGTRSRPCIVDRALHLPTFAALLARLAEEAAKEDSERPGAFPTRQGSVRIQRRPSTVIPPRAQAATVGRAAGARIGRTSRGAVAGPGTGTALTGSS
ncbi:hypothetical protein MKEN_00747100 [Mycena kentingensis (nom. inval.)]|nr:hypothetical protein MKEN_00747100 [Mycena kentingensis (nom. inval.)]